MFRNLLSFGVGERCSTGGQLSCSKSISTTGWWNLKSTVLMSKGKKDGSEVSALSKAGHGLASLRPNPTTLSWVFMKPENIVWTRGRVSFPFPPFTTQKISVHFPSSHGILTWSQVTLPFILLARKLDWICSAQGGCLKKMQKYYHFAAWGAHVLRDGKHNLPVVCSVEFCLYVRHVPWCLVFSAFLCGFGLSPGGSFGILRV